MSCFARHQHRYREIIEKVLPKSFPTSQSREKPEGRLSYSCQFYEECPDADPAEAKCAYNPALSEYCPRYLELLAQKREKGQTHPHR